MLLLLFLLILQGSAYEVGERPDGSLHASGVDGAGASHMHDHAATTASVTYHLLSFCPMAGGFGSPGAVPTSG